MKTIIAGSRTFTDFKLLCISMASVDWEVSEVVSGDARGADKLGEKWGHATHLPVTHFPADWNRHGRGAGHIRNAEMAKYADALVAFWDGKSRGTKGMIDYAAKLGLRVKIVHY